MEIYVTPTVVFKEEYSIDRISMAWNAEYENVFEWPGLYEINVRVKDKDGNTTEPKLNYSTTTSSNGKKYFTIKFDKPVSAKEINVSPAVYPGYNIVLTTEPKLNYSTTTSSNGKKYFTIKFDKPVSAKEINVSPAVYPGYNIVLSIAELKFHKADNIEQDTKNLFKDDFRVELKEDVTQEKIDDIRKRVNTMDPVSKEYHPDRTNIIKELDTAEALLTGANLSKQITTLDTKINNNTGATNLNMSNNWQSLGSVARPGADGDQKKKIVVYVGSDNSNAKVDITFLQNYGQPGKYMSNIYTLTPGRHEITVPEIINEDVEKGGQVMARVSNSSHNSTIKVRLEGVDEIPHLDVNNLINDESKENEVKDKIRTYIKDLKKHVADLPNMYPTSVTDEDRKNNIYTYDKTTSTLNSTDIEGDRFTLTVPATEILRGIESGLNGNENAQIERVYNALLAWEQQMQLAYAKKGVYETGDKATGNHVAPTNRMNIKYQRMMMGAAGYASSHHVGVGFDASDYMRGVPFKFDENKNVINKDEARLYDGLINHEIGHVLDIKARTYDETSNNLMVALSTSMLNQDPDKLGKDTYKNMYEKVTSNTLGLSTDRKVVLGMLWQPHLAYENKDTYKMLLEDDSYFAKLNRAYRDMTDAEKADGDRDQWLIRMTSKVANKNLSKFYLAYGIVPNKTTLDYVSKFEEETRPIQYINDEARRQRLAGNKNLSKFYLAYGIVPNKTTLDYVSKFEEETRPIQYINDEARRQRLAGTANMSEDTKVVASFGKDNKGNQISDRSYVNQDTVPLNLSVTKDNNRILGYEIYRNGKPVGFVERNVEGGLTTYNDVVDNTNNRVFTYEVVAYDYNLKATEKVNLGTVKVRHDGSVNKDNLYITSNTIDNRVFTYEVVAYDYNLKATEKVNLGTVKVRHDGSVNKDNLYITSNTIDVNDSNYDEHSDNPNPSLSNVIDNNNSTVYEGKKHNTSEDPYVIIDAKEVRSLAGIKYTAPTTTTKLFKKTKTSKTAIQNYKVEVSKDGNTWTKVKDGTFNSNNPTETIYFDKEGVQGGNQLNVYNARFVKLTALGATNISIAELDLISPPGDNIEIGVADDCKINSFRSY